MEVKRAIIIGAGQFGRLVLELIKRKGEYECVGFLDAAPSLQGQTICGLPVFGGDDCLEQKRGQLDAVYIALANGDRRKAMQRKAQALGFSTPSIVDHSVNLASDVQLGEGVFISMGATILNATTIGEGSIIGTGVTILHDVVIGAFCTIGGGAVVGAGTKIEEHVFVGVGAVIASGGYRIGAYAKLAAGAVAVKDLQMHAMAMGNPARVISIDGEA